jgi:hypothetical protein
VVEVLGQLRVPATLKIPIRSVYKQNKYQSLALVKVYIYIYTNKYIIRIFFFYDRKCDMNCIEENPASIIRNRVKCFLNGESYAKDNELSKDIDMVNIHHNMCT